MGQFEMHKTNGDVALSSMWRNLTGVIHSLEPDWERREPNEK
jgi:hypothetical protein